MSNLPTAFLDRMQSLLGTEFEAFKESLNKPAQKGIYVNPTKISSQQFKSLANFSLEPIPYEKNGFYVDGEKRGKHPLHHAGAFYIQEPSAMFTVNAYKFMGNEKVLDMCAAPGGKTIQIANRIPNGVLVSNEINPSRCKVLYSNVERMGLKNVIITNDTPNSISSAYGNTFDVCLVDAPCSGEGMFRRGEEVISEWNENLPQMCSQRQKEILESANNCLKIGGVLIYSTCTYSYVENEGVVCDFISKHNYKLLSFKHNFSKGIDLPQAARLYPHQNRGEGQFVAVMVKQEENLESPKPNLALKMNLKAEKFISDFVSEKFNLYEYKDYIYNVLDLNLIKKDVNYYSLGVRALEIKKDRFVPHHYLFSAFGRSFKNTINLDYKSSDALRYLKGETLNLSAQEGFGAVMFNFCPVGGYKMSEGKFKNYYPKGLRNA